MSSLAEELAADRPVYTSCSLCTWISLQPEQTQREWHVELAKPVKVVSHESVRRALGRRGLTIGSSSIKRHRYSHESQ